jgi:hypothetical protein
MDFIKNLFFNLEYIDFTNALIKILIFCLFSAIIIWFVFFIISKLNKRSQIHKDLLLKLNFLAALCIYFLIFNCYIFFFIKLLGIHGFKWVLPEFYLCILDQLFVFIMCVTLFFLIYNNLSKSIKG